MIIVYIIGIFLLLVLAVFLLDKREKMARDIKVLKEKKNDIEVLNSQLDEVQRQLDEMHSSLDKVNQISQKIISYRK